MNPSLSEATLESPSFILLSLLGQSHFHELSLRAATSHTGGETGDLVIARTWESDCPDPNPGSTV